MADIRIVAEVVGANKVNALVNSTKKLEGQVKNLGNAYLSGKIGPEQFNKGLTELRKSANALYPTHQKASAVVTKLARDYVTLTRAQQQDIAATKAYIQARREATAMNQRFNQEKKLEELRVKQATQTLNTYTVASRASSVAQQAATKSNNQLGVVVQQTGYQVGDFLVQIQSGTNPMVAFGQQATQLVGVLPLMASSLGMTAAAAIGLSTALGIGIPLLTAIGAAFLRSRESANKASDGVDTLADSIESLDKSLRDYLQTKKASQLGITVEELLGTQNISEAEAELNSAREALERLITSSSVTPTGIFAGVAIINFIKQKFATDEVTAAVLRLAQAEETLGLLRQKQGEERFSNYAEERVSLQDQLAMAQEIARFGEDSAQVAKLELEQRIAAYDRNIDQLVESNQLNIIHARTLKSTNAELANTEFATKEIARNQEVLKEGAQGFLNIWTAITSRITESSASMRAAQRAIEVGKVADQYAQYGAGRAAFEGIVQGGLGDTTGGVKPPSTPSSRKQGGTTSIKDPLPELMKRLALDERLLGVSEERAAVERAIADSDVTYSQASIDAAVKRLEAYNLEKQALEEIAATQEKIASILESSMESALMSIVDGTKSVKDAFKSMAAEIIKELYRIFVVKRITGMIVGAFGGGSVGMTAAPAVNPMAGMSGAEMLPQAMGGAWMKGVQMFANGGVVDSPTMFGHSGGVGVMGEAGPEAIMPLKRGANGKLGVSVEGGSGSVVVNNNINVTGGSDPAAIRMEVAKLMPQITSATKSAVIDARRRGGQMRAAFN
jgi:hypothetical protein